MQQSTVMLSSGHPLKALTGLSRAIALPQEHAPQRFPSFPALERTAVLGFTQPVSLSLPASTAVKMMLSRQASYPAWADQTVTSAGYMVCYNTELPPGGASTIFTIPIEKTPVNWFVSTGGFPTPTAAYPAFSTGNLASPLPYPVMGMDGSTGAQPYVYVPPGWNVYAIYSNGYAGNGGAMGSAATAVINCDVWSSPGESRTTGFSVSVAATNVSGMSGALAGANGIWIRPAFVDFTAATANTYGPATVTLVVVAGTATHTPSVSTAGNVNLSGSATGLFPLVVSSEFANSQLPWFATRTTAAGMLGTNVTQVLNKAGTILGGRISPNVINPWQVAAPYISALHPAEKAWMALETGLYTFCPPSTDMANFWDCTIPTAARWGSSAPAPAYRLDNDAMVNILFVTAGSVAEALAVTVSWHIEFRTSSALFPVALSGMPLETLHSAQLVLASAGFFFDNPDHKAILNAIIAGANRFAPAAMAAIKAYNPALGSVVSAGYRRIARTVNQVKDLKPKQAKMAMDPTSASGSGMTRKPKKGKQGKKGKSKK